MGETVSLDELNFAKGGGLLSVIIQDSETGQVLMAAFANREAVERTMREGVAYLWSRTRNKIWMKGEGSGNVQRVVKVLVDCDADALIYLVKPRGPACHTGHTSCFYRELTLKNEELG